MKSLLRALLIIITVGYISGCGYGSHPKNGSYIELEISLKDINGTPLTHYPFRVDTASYSDDLTATTSTDENGMFKFERYYNRTTTWLWEGMVPPDKPKSNITLDFYLPDVNPYGEYPTLILLGNSDETKTNTSESEYPHSVPAKINPNKQAVDQPSKFVHGAYYHAYAGTLNTAVIIANGQSERLIPLIPRGATAFMKKIDVPIDPRLKITASKSILNEKRGWLLKLDLVLMPE